jgi:DNA-binding SARP family transcriptional activator
MLAMLGLNANHVTTSGQLIDAFWADDPPPSARGQVQVCVYQLRKLFAEAGHPEVITTQSVGYVLRLPEDGIDSRLFTDAVELAKKQADEGRHAEAVQTLRGGLDLWRGPALAGLESAVLRRAAAALDEQRMLAIEERTRLQLQLGRHEGIIAELVMLVDEHPLREQLYGYLMRALYRSGRQAEALEVYQRARATLVEEIGVEPGQELQDLHQAILNRDAAYEAPPQATTLLPAHPTAPPSAHPAAHPAAQPAGQPMAPPAAQSAGQSAGRPADHSTDPFMGRSMGAPSAGPPGAEQAPRPQRAEPGEASRWSSPWQLPATTPDFTGRTAEVPEIKALLAGGTESGYAMPIVGISGRGGVGKSALAIRAAHELHDVFCDGALYAEFQGPLPGPLQGPPDDARTASQLARFLRALGVAGNMIPDSLDERIDLYRTSLATRRVLVVLDDVGDESQVRPLLPGSPTCGVIVTSRRELNGLPGAYHINLETLAAEESREMLGRILGAGRVAAESEAVVELNRLCDGLPLALRIAAARLSSRKLWPIGHLVERLRDEVRRLDELEHRGWALRPSFDLTYKSLDEPARRLFRLLSIVQAPDVPSWTAAALLDTGLTEAEDVLEQLVDARVLEEVEYSGTVNPRYRLHALLRVYAHEQVMTDEPEEAREEALRRVFGMWLALAGTAHHMEYGGDFTVIHGAAPRWSPPGVDLNAIVVRAMDWWDAERASLVAAVRQAAEMGLDEFGWDLALTCVTLFEAKAYYDDWWLVARAAFEAAERAGNALGLAAMHYSMGTLHMFQGRLGPAEEHYRSAMALFEEQGNEHGYALVLRNHANIDGLRGDHDEMIAKYERARELLERVGDKIGMAHIMRSQAKHWLPLGETARAYDLLTRALEVCGEVRCVRVEAQIRHTFAELQVLLGDLDGARQELHRVLRIVRDRGDRLGEVHALYSLGVVQQREGRLDSAESTMGYVIELTRATGEQTIEGKAVFALSEIALVRGNVPLAVKQAGRAGEIFEELGSSVWVAKATALLSDIQATRGDAARPPAELYDIRSVLGADSARSTDLVD